MGKEYRPARQPAHLICGAVLLALAGCGPAAQPVTDAPAIVSSTDVIPTEPFSVAPGEPEAGIPPPSASADAAGDTGTSFEDLSPRDMELMKQSVIADWRLSRDRRSKTPVPAVAAPTVAARAEPASPPPGATPEQPPAAPVPAQPAQSAGPIPCSMLPATATPCLRN